jgi:hypothetical protein
VETRTDMFYGARLKITRANEHIHDLDRMLDSFLRTDFYKFGLHQDPKTGECFLECSTTPMPERVPLILGDALHNLRTSLDFVATEIARKADQPTPFTKFPFRKTKQEVLAAIKGGSMRAAPAPVISTIVEQIRPYKGGDDFLYALHVLDIIDKHHLIVPTVSIITVCNVDLDWGNGMHMERCTFIVEAGNRIRFGGGPLDDLRIQSKGNAVAEIKFGQGVPIEMQPVVPTLRRLSTLVSGCVDALAEAYVAGA